MNRLVRPVFEEELVIAGESILHILTPCWLKTNWFLFIHSFVEVDSFSSMTIWYFRQFVLAMYYSCRNGGKSYVFSELTFISIHLVVFLCIYLRIKRFIHAPENYFWLWIRLSFAQIKVDCLSIVILVHFSWS